MPFGFQDRPLVFKANLAQWSYLTPKHYKYQNKTPCLLVLVKYSWGMGLEVEFKLWHSALEANHTVYFCYKVEDNPPIHLP